MVSNKKGLSDVVTTLIIVLLAVGAVAIVGGVIMNLVNKQSKTMTAQEKCLNAYVSPTSLNCENSTGYWMCSVDLERQTAGSNEVLAGVETVYTPYNTTLKQTLSKKGPMEETGDVQAVVGKKVTQNTTVLYSADIRIKAVDATPYFLDESGNKIRCNTRSYILDSVV